MLVTILGKRWRFERVRNLRHEGKRVDGLCDDPTETGKTITIEDRLTGERELDVILHELAHASGWHIDHEYVTQFAEDAARILTKLGYRRVPG